MTEKITTRPATVDDLDTIAKMMSIGFGGDVAARRAILENHPRYNYRDMIIGEIDGRSVGKATAFPTQMWISGVPLQMGAVAGVTTLPDFRQRGVSSAIMHHVLEKMYEDEMAITVLFPGVHNLYYRFGFADAATWHFYSLTTNNLPHFAENSEVRPFVEDDLTTIRSLYRGVQLSQADGRLTRSNAWWERLVAHDQRQGNNCIVVYAGADGVEGYLKYSITDKNVLKVREMFAVSDAAYRGLWGYMGTQQGITSIDYLAPADDPILHLLQIPQDSSGGNRGWIFNDIYHATSSIMLRVVHLAEALTSRFYPHDMMGNRILKIEDPQLPGNQAPINFRIVDGRPDIIPIDGQSPQVETDIATFSQIFCGFLAPELARRLGRLQADDESIVWLTRAMAANPLFIPSDDWF